MPKGEDKVGTTGKAKGAKWNKGPLRSPKKRAWRIMLSLEIVTN